MDRLPSSILEQYSIPENMKVKGKNIKLTTTIRSLQHYNILDCSIINKWLKLSFQSSKNIFDDSLSNF